MAAGFEHTRPASPGAPRTDVSALGWYYTFTSVHRDFDFSVSLLVICQNFYIICVIVLTKQLI